MFRRISENALFFREFLRNHYYTGAVLPSGPRLAAALASYVGPRSDCAALDPSLEKSRNILEVGPGSGAVTRRIIAEMGPADSLDLVELNGEFVRQLNGRFLNDPKFQPVAGRARVLHCPVEKLPSDRHYEVIVSGLPLNNFAAADVERILAVLVGLLSPGGTLSFFEYIAVRPARAMVSGASERERLRGVGRAMRAVLDSHEIRRDTVWLNVPPAWVHHVRQA